MKPLGSKRRVAFTVAVMLSILVEVFAIVFWQHPSPKTEVYSFPIVVGEKTYVVSVLTNYSSEPKVSYSQEGKAVNLDFSGKQENAFFNVTIPTALTGGEIKLIDKYYEVSPHKYVQSFNGTHNSVYFTFDRSAYVKHFEVRGTEAAT
jgi:hypothetical protein